MKGAFFNGDDKTTSTSGSLENGTLSLNFDELGTKLEATLKDGRLDGEYSRGTRGAPYPFHGQALHAGAGRRREDAVDRRAVERAGRQELEG